MNLVERQARPVPMAQRLELLDRWERAGERHEFRPGDLVRQKAGLHIIRDEDAHQLLFWSWLDVSNPVHAARLRDEAERLIIFPDVDCFVVTLSDDGTALLFFLAPSLFLEPDPAAAAAISLHAKECQP